jgi:hypothetical protein
MSSAQQETKTLMIAEMNTEWYRKHVKMEGCTEER